MISSLIFCTSAFLFGFATARAMLPLCLVMSSSREDRVSYGGVRRFIAANGGVVLALSVAVGLIPFVTMGIFSWGLPVLAALFCTLGIVRFRLPRTAFKICLIAVLIALPDRNVSVVVIACLCAMLMAEQISSTDQVPGIPAAIHAPPLAASSAVLLLTNGASDALIGLIAAGALVALQALHRFPPRLALGRGGVITLASLHGVIVGGLLAEGNYLALLMLWSFPLVDAACRIIMGSASSPFENARLRGEPEAGLALAAGSLSVANVVAMSSVYNNALAVQIIAVAISLLAAFQFHRFLMRGQQGHLMRSPYHQRNET